MMKDNIMKGSVYVIEELVSESHQPSLADRQSPIDSEQSYDTTGFDSDHTEENSKKHRKSYFGRHAN